MNRSDRRAQRRLGDRRDWKPPKLTPQQAKERYTQDIKIRVMTVHSTPAKCAQLERLLAERPDYLGGVHTEHPDPVTGEIRASFAFFDMAYKHPEADWPGMPAIPIADVPWAVQILEEQMAELGHTDFWTHMEWCFQNVDKILDRPLPKKN